MPDPIVVTGISLNAPFGRTTEDLWTLLAGNAPVPRPVERFAVEGCRVRKAHLHWPSQDVDALFEGARATGQAALDAAGVAPRDTGLRIGLAVGSISGVDLDNWPNAAASPQGAEVACSANALGQYCIEGLELTGPLVHVMSACTSSAAALFWAKAILENGDVDVMLVGGADRIRPVDFAGFNILRAMDPDQSRPFHEQRKGITMGEGACFLVLEALSHARARGAEILAVFAGGGLSCDAHHATAPKSDGLVVAGRHALAAAGLAPDDIQYVNCHGTGTVANDSEELKALQSIFGARLPQVRAGSTKGFTGHWLGTAGALEAAIAVMVLRRQQAPGMPWLDDGDSILAPYTDPEADTPAFRHVMSNSLGFGGNNVSLVFSKFDRTA